MGSGGEGRGGGGLGFLQMGGDVIMRALCAVGKGQRNAEGERLGVGWQCYTVVIEEWALWLNPLRIKMEPVPCRMWNPVAQSQE